MESGKDETYRQAKLIHEETTTGVIRDAFADRLKLSAARCFIPDATLEEALTWCNMIKQDGWLLRAMGPDDKSYAIVSGREFLQHYGTEAHRQVFEQDFWIRAVIPDPIAPDLGRKDTQSGDILMVTDVRFPNEAEAIHQIPGAEVWKIYRPEAEEKAAQSTHASEKPLPDELITRTIDNSRDIVHLRDQVYKALYGVAEYDDRELVDSAPKGHGVSISGGNW